MSTEKSNKHEGEEVKISDRKNELDNPVEWGDIVEVTTIGMWGHDAYTRTYTYSGSKGHFPNTRVRLTMIGDGSVAKEAFIDLTFERIDYYAGFKNSLYRIDSITRI